jgi:DNA-binding beta-propeller fold protein YncE
LLRRVGGLARAGAALAGMACVVGCARSSDVLAPAAEPASSPVTAVRPEGRVIELGNKPEGMTVDPRTGLLAVALKTPNRVALVDADRPQLVRRLSLPGPARHLALARPGGPVLAPVEKAGTVAELSLREGPRRRLTAGQGPHDAAPAAGGDVWVTDELEDRVTVIRPGRSAAGLDAPIDPDGVAATTDGRYAAVVGAAERAVRLYDARTFEPLRQADAGLGPTHVAAGRRAFFVVDTRGDALLVLRVRGRDLVLERRIRLGGIPYGIAFDPVRRRLWVTLTASNRVAELSPRRVLRTFPTVRQPNSVAVDPRSGRVFVASRARGTLQWFDAPPLRSGGP